MDYQGMLSFFLFGIEALIYNIDTPCPSRLEQKIVAGGPERAGYCRSPGLS